ncbi:hypothetical protein [Marinicellulosiphila megalodicopiae]|uniref:hypothetical protein n=1 Tax=Marinicellulosiphila megalodicopiae TaxID=2724896 RepID=UPI003BB09909
MFYELLFYEFKTQVQIDFNENGRFTSLVINLDGNDELIFNVDYSDHEEITLIDSISSFTYSDFRKEYFHERDINGALLSKNRFKFR